MIFVHYIHVRTADNVFQKELHDDVFVQRPTLATIAEKVWMNECDQNWQSVMILFSSTAKSVR